MNNLVTFRQTLDLPTNQRRVSRWTQRLYKVLQTRNDSRDADVLFRSFSAMATAEERRQLRTAYDVIRQAFLAAYDTTKAVTDRTPTPEPTPCVKYDKSWGGDYAAYRHYAKDTAWLESQFSVV